MRDLIGITYDAGAGGPELTAAEWRQLDTALFVRNSSDLVISGVRGGAVSNTGFSATIAPLTAVVQTTAALGAYIAAFPAGAAELSKTISAAHATLPRVDAIDVKIYDHEADSSTFRGADIVYTAGTANASPSAPAFSGVGVRLGTFAVPASGGGNPVWTINPALIGYAGQGGILDVATQPSSPRAGTVIYNRVTGIFEYYNGTTWLALSNATPTVNIYNANDTWSKPAGAKWVEVEMWGGGGGSGAAGGGAGQATGGGGGAGAYCRKLYAASALNSTEAVVVGAGGTGTPTNGNAGGSSSYKALTAGGGTGGTSMATNTGNGLASGGVGGTASGGDENITGGDGGKGGTFGGAAVFSNYGGAAPRGGGQTTFAGSTAGIGTTGKGPGGGAAGSFAGGAGFNGGAGAAGRVIVRTYF